MTIPARRDEYSAKSLSDIFNSFAGEAARLFPAIKGRLLVSDTNEKKTYGRQELNLQKAGYLPKLVDAYLKKNTNPKTAETSADYDNSLNLYHIVYNEPVAPAERKAVPAKTEKEILFTLDHELGHIVIKYPAVAGENEQYKVALGESIADAFAAIRHYQRYGMDSDYQASIMDPWARAAALALQEDAVHFTTVMHQEIIRLKGQIDYAALTPQQTIELARRFATEYTPPSSVVNRLMTKLKPVRQAYNEDPDSDKWLRILASITLSPKTDSYTFRICKLVLEGYLDGRTDAYGVSAPVRGNDWDDVRKKLKEAEIKHAKDGILFNLDAASQKPARRKPANENKKPPAGPAS